MELRESVCRHFVCPGIGWWKDEKLAKWKNYFDQLADNEINLNNFIAAEMEREKLSLRNSEDWDRILVLIDHLVEEALSRMDEWDAAVPEQEAVVIKRRITYGIDWPL
jgi:predicted secreted Zn-dependent protease